MMPESIFNSTANKRIRHESCMTSDVFEFRGAFLFTGNDIVLPLQKCLFLSAILQINLASIVYIKKSAAISECVHMRSDVDRADAGTYNIQT